MTNVTFNWSIPAIPNGIITQYNLTVVNLDTPNTTSYIIDVTADQQQVSQLVTGFRPYESYTATVTGTTLVGYGPVAVIEGRTSKLYNISLLSYNLVSFGNQSMTTIIALAVSGVVLLFAVVIITIVIIVIIVVCIKKIQIK